MALRRFNTLSVLLIFSSVVTVVPWRHTEKQIKTSLGYPKDSLLNFTELTAKYGYISEEHKVVTDDGYILTMFRIVKGRNCHQKKRIPPVLLMHGLLLSSDCWIDSGPNSGLAYLISDACHDLWVGNARGNYYSRGHVRLNPDKDPEYWNFDIEQMGTYDLPAMIDYILHYSGLIKLNYIGFSQGTGTFLVMCSERPEYCKKVQLLIALAPAARQTNTKSKLFRFLLQTLEVMEDDLSKQGIGEVLTKGSLVQEFSAFLCQLPELSKYSTCGKLLQVFDHVDFLHSGSITNRTVSVLMGHFPAGTSVHNMARYGQSTKISTFEKFNYGKEKNLLLYGSEKPPKYNISATTVPVVNLYGQNDGLVDVKDVEWMVSKLPNVLESIKVNNPLWTHLDMTYSQYTRVSLFPKINEYLLKYSRP